MKTDIEIARESKLESIYKLAQKAGIPEDALEPYGKYMAKIDIDKIDQTKKDGNLILVTAITPTKAGIGKTTVSIGLALGMQYIGKKAMLALREPSLGPCFGMKGGAAGGGYAQVLPMDKINLHFTGDFHAITSANNMIAALLDNYAYQNRNNENGLSKIIWKRVLDVNDRSLRHVITGLGGVLNGIPTETGFDISPASEIMALLCLSKDMEDLRRRLDNILLAYKKDGSAFYLRDLGIGGSIAVLLKDALLPNLVQTTENSPALLHGGPFANIAHGCNSVIATKTALKLADYVITEAGFAADLGGEKFFDIKCRQAGLNPKLTIIVATAQALKAHGGVEEAKLKKSDTEALSRGFANLDRHIENMQKFAQSIVVCINRYPSDTDEEIELIRQHCSMLGLPFAVNESYMLGGSGAADLARVVVDTIENKPSSELRFIYELNQPIIKKLDLLAREIYRADGVDIQAAALKKIEQIEKDGLSAFPICVAKTQYSFSDDAKKYGAPNGFRMTVNDVIVNTGAELIVVIMGSIMRMPGLPKSPAALNIDLVDGEIVGLS